MRRLALLLLLPTLAFAQQPAEKMTPQQYFEMSKARMQPIMAESLPAMRKTLDCMKQADDQPAYEKCAEIMSELDNKMREKMGVPGLAPGDKQPKAKDPKSLEWNAENKQKMLKFLEHSIEVGTAMNDCFTKSSKVEEMQQCMQANKPKP